MKRLNLGCGRNVKDGWLNVDIVNGTGVNCVYDLNETPWPWKTSDVHHVLMDNVLEHFRDTERIIKEVARVLAPGGWFYVIVPHYLSPSAHRPNHFDTFSTSYFNGYTEQGTGVKGLDREPLFDLDNVGVMHKIPHGLWLPKPVRILKPHKIRFALRRNES